MADPGGRSNLPRVFFGVIAAVIVAALFFAGRIPDPPAVVLGDAALVAAGDSGKAEETPAGGFDADRPLVAVEGVPESYGLKPVKPFQVRSRVPALEFYPCSDCHEGEPINPRERKLTEEHETITLDHGGGRFWCLTCHGSKSKDTLTSLKGEAIEFNKPFLLCGQCHFQRQKDWYAGGHGKRLGRWPGIYQVPTDHTELKVAQRTRIGTWAGERRVLVCTECHNSHSPSIKPIRPSPPPGPRVGLSHQNFRAPPRKHVWDDGAAHAGGQ